MNNRNLLIFVLASAALLGAHAFLMGRLYPKPAQPQAAPPPAVQAPAPAPPAPQPAAAPATPATPAAAQPPAASAQPPAAAAQAPVILENRELRLVFRVKDGALVQATWLADGTRFFNEAARDDKGKEEVSRDFPGLGGALGLHFAEGEAQVVEGRPAARFRTPEGDSLEYRLDGHHLDVALASTRPDAALALLPLPADELEAKGLGRVFTLDDKRIDAVAWSAILTDPFFKFVGAKRKELPPANVKVGMDAGQEQGSSNLTTHYFAALWDLPRPAARDRGYHLKAEQGRASARLYLGPKQPEALAAFGKAFTQVQDFGFFGSVAKFLFWVLRAIHGAVGNWGWAILIFTLILRFALWPLNTKMVVSQLRMKDLEPHQKAIQAKYEKFGNDMAKKAEMQRELMDFYKKNGHNPMGGCLPMLLQMPVFLALWSMLTNVFELRHAPFALWIRDLSAKDPFYVLPVLLGASMVAQSALAPPMGDPQQRKMMMVLMPVMMVFFFAQSPAGLSLYYLMFNLIGLFQTWWVSRTHKALPVVV